MTLKNGFGKSLLFVLPANGWSKYGLFVLPRKKTLIWRRHCSIGQSFAVWRQSEVSVDFYKVLGHEVFSPERSLNLPKATRVCIRSTNQSKPSMSVRLLFLFCSRIFISRSYENRTIFKLNCTTVALPTLHGYVLTPPDDPLKIWAFRCSVHTK